MGTLNSPVLRGLPAAHQSTSLGAESTRVQCDHLPLCMGFLYTVDGQLARSDRACDLRGITDEVIVPIAGLSLEQAVANFSFFSGRLNQPLPPFICESSCSTRDPSTRLEEWAKSGKDPRSDGSPFLCRLPLTDALLPLSTPTANQGEL